MQSKAFGVRKTAEELECYLAAILMVSYLCLDTTPEQMSLVLQFCLMAHIQVLHPGTCIANH